MSKKSLVALAHGLDVQENVTRVFDMMGGAAKMIEPNSTVVLKPNAGHAAPPEFAVCTHPETVRAVIREVKKANPKRIVIAEAAAVGCDTDECYEACGIAAVAREEGVELVDIKKDKDLINVAVRGYRSNISHVKLPRLLLEAEHIINLPILKAHASMVFSGALKNIKGVVQDQVHVQMHQQNLTMAMMDVWWACRADINIMDVMHAAIEVVGDKVADCYKKMWVPYLEDIRNRWPEYEVHCEGACSSCQALLTLNMETLKAIGVYDDNTDMVVVAGGRNTLSPDTPDEKILLHGNCARKHLKEHPNAFFLQGCPPGEGSLYMSVLRKEAMTGKPEQMHWIRERMEIDAPAWRSYVEKEAEKFYGSDDK